MSSDDFSHLAAQHELGDNPVPDVVLDRADGSTVELVWRNDLGGLTFRLGNGLFVKWNPHSTGIDLDLERVRLEWLEGRHPAPRVVDHGATGAAQYLVTEALPGGHAVGDAWRARRPEAIAAIATGLRALHAVPIDDFPHHWVEETWLALSPAALGPRPEVVEPVLVHGDACAPNTLISSEGTWTGHVDLGDLAVGDRWADLAVASLSLDWNFGEGHQNEFFAAYGVEPDPVRIEYYRTLWETAP